MSGVGGAIRRVRLDGGRLQAEVARRAGISASYLALIERGRRPVARALLVRLAVALDISPSRLTGEADDDLLSELTNAANEAGMDEPARADASELILRYPAWAGLIADQASRIETGRAALHAMQDRLDGDETLDALIHEVLTTAASVRSTAAILVQTPELDAAWQARFQGNLDAEARRLAAATEAVAVHLGQACGARDEARAGAGTSVRTEGP